MTSGARGQASGRAAEAASYDHGKPRTLREAGSGGESRGVLIAKPYVPVRSDADSRHMTDATTPSRATGTPSSPDGPPRGQRRRLGAMLALGSLAVSLLAAEVG